MDGETKKAARRYSEPVRHLRRLARWKNNDAVKLAWLGEEQTDQIDGLDLTGVTELKRHGNGSVELKFVDKVRVLDLLGQLLDRRDDRELGRLLDELGTAESGDGQ